MATVDLSWNLAVREIFQATYAAYFVSQVRDHIREGRGAPEPEHYDRFDEEAETVALEAVERVRLTG